MENTELQALTREVAGVLAQATGDAWTYVERDDTYTHVGRIARADGPVVFVHGPSYQHKGKLSITGDYPRDAEGQYVYVDWDDRQAGAPSIGVGEGRGAKVVASEIARRFLPAYLDRYAKVAERVAASNAHDEARKALADRLAAAIGTTARHDRGGSEVSVSVNNDGGYGDVHVSSGNSVSIDLRSVTPEVAEAVLRVVTGK